MITYPLIASEILNRLFEGPKRSSDLTKGLGFSSKLIYQTLDEMEKDDILSVQTDRPKFKVYQITNKGSEIAIDSKVKSQSGAMQEMKKYPELNRMFAEMYKIILHQEHYSKVHVHPTAAISIATASELLIPSAAAYSRSVKRIFDDIDNQASKTLAATIEISTNAT